MSITLLCEIIAQRGKALAVTYRAQEGYHDLIRVGLVREAGVVQSIVCDVCDDPHDASVVFEDGQYGHYCPELGLAALERDQIVGVEADIGKLVDGLASALDCRRQKSTPIHGETWRVGVSDPDQWGVAIYLHPRLQDATDLQDFEAALRREVASPCTVALTACGSLATSASQTVNLADVVDLDPVTGALVVISDLFAIAGVRPERKGGAPNRFRAEVKVLIAERERNGRTLPGTNKEAKAIISDFSERFPSAKAPSLATVKRYMQEFETGS